MAAPGYEYEHQALRKRRLAAYRPGDPCAMGGEPLPYPKAVAARFLHLPHDHANGGYLPGLSCRRHNVAEANQRRVFQPWHHPQGSHPVCRACGREYRRKASACVICGAHYHPSRADQRACGRECGAELRRRNARTTVTIRRKSQTVTGSAVTIREPW